MKRHSRQRNQPPFAEFYHWSLPKVIVSGLVAHGGFGSLMVLLPPLPSGVGLAVGLSFGLVVFAARLLYWHTGSWWALVFFAQGFTLQILGLAVAGIAHARGFTPLWLLPLAAIHVAALALPMGAGRVSSTLWRELTAPKSRVGRGCLIIGLAVLPIAGVAGGVWGLWARRLDMTHIIMPVAMGGLGLLAATIAGFTFSYQLWPLRPWAATGEKGKL